MGVSDAWGRVIENFLATRFPASVAQKLKHFITEYLRSEVLQKCKYNKTGCRMIYKIIIKLNFQERIKQCANWFWDV